MTSEPTPGLPALRDGWLERAMTSSSDQLFIIDAATVVTWVNPAGAALVGLEPSEVVGRSLAEFLHPDDLLRAAEVLTLAGSGVFDALPITPALYRVRATDGEWLSIEVNSSLPQPDGSTMIIGRVGGDLVLADQLLEAVTAGDPLERQVALVMQMAAWRHPGEGYAILYSEDGSQRSVITSEGLPGELYGAVEVAGPTPWDVALSTGTEVVVHDLLASVEVGAFVSPALARAARAAGMTGCMAAPVHDPSHVTDACILIWTTERGPTASGHGYAMANMRRALALVLQQRAQVLLLERAARVDVLTGLTTRARFFELLADREADAGPDTVQAVLYIDLDGFKAVNDNHGHAVGDRVLSAAGSRLSDLVPDGSILARLGGDEFVLVCPPDTSPDAATRLAQQIVDAMAQPIASGIDADAPDAATNGSVAEIRVGASVGVAVGRVGEPLRPVMEAADAALFKAKADGRGCWRSR